MTQTVEVYFLPKLIDSSKLADSAVVVIDVLRATTTIVHALANGAEMIIPCDSIQEARSRQSQSAHRVLLGGERHGLKVDGFDLGNSPSQYVPEVVSQARIAFTTTNGTRALLACQRAERVLVGAFTNFSSVCGQLKRHRAVNVVCSGTDGDITREDVLLAGALVDRIAGGPADATLNDQSVIARDAWVRHVNSDHSLYEALRNSRGGRNLARIAMMDDIRIAAEIDSTSIVPVFDPAERTIRVR